MADEGLDYDDLISQNILIRREEKEDKTATVEVLTKQNDDYENLYQKQAEIYHMDVDLHGYMKAGSEQGESNESSDYEVVVKPVKRNLSPDYDDDSSSDSDWEVAKKRKAQKGLYQCDECDKKCATKHGLLMHKRSHERQKLKMRKQETPPASPLPVQVELSVPENKEPEIKEKVVVEGAKVEDVEEENVDEEEDVEEEEEEEEAGGDAPGNGETQEDEDDDDEEEEDEAEEVNG